MTQQLETGIETNGATQTNSHIVTPKLTPIKNFAGANILSAAQWDLENLAEVHTLTVDAQKLHETKRGRMQLIGRKAGAEMFLGIYQLSSRTRGAFDVGMDRVGGRVYSEGPAESSRGKGEPLEHTIGFRTRGGLDIAVIRDKQTGYFWELLPYLKVPLINAGDGEGEHPFQAAKDHEIMTQTWPDGNLHGLNITYGFEQEFSRVIHSNMRIVSLYEEVRINCVSDPSLRPPQHLLDLMATRGVEMHFFENLAQAEEGGAFTGQKQALYVTRLPDELLDEKVNEIHDSDTKKETTLKAEMQAKINWIRCQYAKTAIDLDFISRHPELWLFHAMPINRGNGNLGEIRRELDYHPQNKMLDQAGIGFYVSSALIQLVLANYH